MNQNPHPIDPHKSGRIFVHTKQRRLWVDGLCRLPKNIWLVQGVGDLIGDLGFHTDDDVKGKASILLREPKT